MEVVAFLALLLIGNVDVMVEFRAEHQQFISRS